MDRDKLAEALFLLASECERAAVWSREFEPPGGTLLEHVLSAGTLALRSAVLIAHGEDGNLPEQAVVNTAAIYGAEQVWLLGEVAKYAIDAVTHGFVSAAEISEVTNVAKDAIHARRTEFDAGRVPEDLEDSIGRVSRLVAESTGRISSALPPGVAQDESDIGLVVVFSGAAQSAASLAGNLVAGELNVFAAITAWAAAVRAENAVLRRGGFRPICAEIAEIVEEARRDILRFLTQLN